MKKPCFRLTTSSSLSYFEQWEKEKEKEEQRKKDTTTNDQHCSTTVHQPPKYNNDEDDATTDKKEENKAAEKRSRKRSRLRTPPKLYLFDILKKDTTTSADDNSSLFGFSTSKIERKYEPAVSEVVKRYEKEEGFLELRLGINGGYDPVMLFGVRISPSNNKEEEVSGEGVCMEKEEQRKKDTTTNDQHCSTTVHQPPKLYRFNNDQDTTTDDQNEENKAAEKRSRKRSRLRPPPKLYLFDILKKDTTTSADDNSSLFGFSTSKIERKYEPAVSEVVKRYEKEEGFLELTLGINGGYDPVMLFGVRISPSYNKEEEVSGKGVCMEKNKINTITKTKPSSAADTQLSLMTVEREQPSSSDDTLQALMVAPLLVVGNNNTRVNAKRKEPKPAGDSHRRKRQRLEAEQNNKNPIRDIVIYDQGNINNQSASIAVQPDMFKFKKILQKSDVNKLSRLLVTTGMAEHFNAFLNEEQLQLVKSDDGLKVMILDLDSNDEHELFYKNQSSMKNVHIFKSNWVKSFVSRRNLQAGDEIGMCFQDAKAVPPRLAFSVLRRKTAGSI